MHVGPPMGGEQSANLPPHSSLPSPSSSDIHPPSQTQTPVSGEGPGASAQGGGEGRSGSRGRHLRPGKGGGVGVGIRFRKFWRIERMQGFLALEIPSGRGMSDPASPAQVQSSGRFTTCTSGPACKDPCGDHVWGGGDSAQRGLPKVPGDSNGWPVLKTADEHRNSSC